MQLTMVGLSHKTAPVEIREKLTFPAKVQEDAIANLLADEAVFEAVILSTCNRTEIYAVTAADQDGCAAVIDFMAEYHDLDRVELSRYLYSSQGEAVVRHLFRVVSSLDSMVLGEAQILHQVKEAYECSFSYSGTGRVFNKLFRQSFEVGKRVRTETEIGENAVSISYAAIELAKKVFASLEGRSVLILGAGKMSELTAKHLVANGVRNVMVANRTFSRAEELAARFGGVAIPWDEIYTRLRESDIVMSSTSATEYVLRKDDVAKAARQRRDPLFLIDIAVPRDIDPACADVNDVFVYDIDDLNGVVSANLEERMMEAHRAEAIVEDEIEVFAQWIDALEVVPTVAAMRAKAEAIRAAELSKAMKRLGGLSDKELRAVEAMSNAIVNKMMHGPTERLKKVSNDHRYGIAYIEAARFLWGLDTNPDGRVPHGLLRGILGRGEKTSAQASPPVTSGEMGDGFGC